MYLFLPVDITYVSSNFRGTFNPFFMGRSFLPSSIFYHYALWEQNYNSTSFKFSLSDAVRSDSEVNLVTIKFPPDVTGR